MCLVTQVCPSLCNPVDCSRQAPPSMGILQARILEWVAMPSSRGSSPPRDRTHVSPRSHIVCIFFTPKPLGKPSKVAQCSLISW